MAVTKAQSEAGPAPVPSEGGPAPVDAPKQQTRLDSDVSKPGNVAPGEAPYDTTDPYEIASSVSPDKGAAAAAGFGVVNAVQKLDRIPGSLTPEEVAEWNGESGGEQRSETYQAVGPDGKIVTVKHNLETGETSV
jgi:hypothetical protein